jgi:hypothetical protein
MLLDTVQLSARDRSGLVCDSTGLSPDPNNNANIGGYSGYFGRYQVDAKAGTVTHVLEGALSPADAGKHLRRRFRLVGDTLTIQFEPSTPEGIGRARWFGTGSAPERLWPDKRMLPTSASRPFSDGRLLWWRSVGT